MCTAQWRHHSDQTCVIHIRIKKENVISTSETLWVIPSKRASPLASITLGRSLFCLFLNSISNSPTVCPPFVSSRLCATLCLRDPLCFHLLVVYSFSLLYRILIYYYITLHFFFVVVDGHLSCFWLLWIVILWLLYSCSCLWLAMHLFSKRVFKVAVAICTPMSYVWKWQRLKIFPNNYSVLPVFFIFVLWYLFVVLSCISWWI